MRFHEAALTGLAPDGGLYVPERWPSLPKEQIAEHRSPEFSQTAEKVLSPLIDPDAAAGFLPKVLEGVAASFDHKDVVPLRRLDDELWLLELFHGPTLSFKDLAMQFLAGFMAQDARQTNREFNILTATSGDTGAAAVQAFKGRSRVRLFTLFPEGRISDMQRRQMTTVDTPNVFNLAIRGTFDDCQRLVKAILKEDGHRGELSLTTVNSVNWARIAMQTSYYFQACLSLPENVAKPVFIVPTGNLGNAYAGIAARCMGAPITRIGLATNANDALPRMFSGGNFRPRRTISTHSPAMDIQNASNLERVFYEASGRQAAAIESAMRKFELEGALRVPEPWRGFIAKACAAVSVRDEEILRAIKSMFRQHGLLIDPHTAVGFAAAEGGTGCRGRPKVILATAHPAKFPEIVLAATGREPNVPARLQRHLSGRESYITMNPELDRVREFIKARILE